MSKILTIRELQYQCTRCKSIIFQRDTDESRTHEQPKCLGELRPMPFDPRLYIYGRAAQMDGQARQCACGNWFVSRGEDMCWQCVNGAPP
jgi:hypothetical protein